MTLTCGAFFLGEGFILSQYAITYGARLGIHVSPLGACLMGVAAMPHLFAKDPLTLAFLAIALRWSWRLGGLASTRN
ncbi:MAG: hypothetical protein JOZ57_00550 [Abitibacteriaceae bacterium]|nr:hypothetical protein [Abditibacteriaceae bacterium]